MKRAVFNSDNFSLIQNITSSKLVGVYIETITYEVYSYNTLMGRIIIKDIGGYSKEMRYYPHSDFYSVTTAKHIRKALEYANSNLLAMFNEYGGKKAMLNKVGFGMSFIRGEGTKREIYK